jgi:2-alkenal reductase
MEERMRRTCLTNIVLVLAVLALILGGCGLPAFDSSLASQPASTSVPATPAQPTALPTSSTPNAQPTVAPSPIIPPDGQAALQVQQRAFEDLYTRVRPSVVQIVVSGTVLRPDIEIPEPFRNLPDLPFNQPNQPQQFRREGQGSGFIYDADGHIVTNNHVVEGADTIQVTFSDDTVITATLVGRDPFADLAVIKVSSLPASVQPLPLGRSSDLRVGQIVVALGNPFGLPGSMTTGIISGLGRELPASTNAFRLPGVIQTDAAINPGNSGGPLLDLDGHVIGINTAIESPSGAFAGVGFAVPADQVARVAPALIREGRYHYPWIGVELLTVTPDLARELGLKVDHGALVGSVTSGGPAERAGLKGGGATSDLGGRQIRTGGDIITAVDAVPMKASDDVIRAVLAHQVGDTLDVTILRDGSERHLPVTLGERPAQPEQPNG